MPRIRGVIRLRDARRGIGGAQTSPLRCAYVRHEPVGPTYITDINGVIRDADGNEGVDSATTSADLTIICQNSVARVVDGADPLQRCPVVPTFTMHRPRNGGRATATITANIPGINIAHFRILNQAFDAYHLVWRQFEPFLSSGEFPLGRNTNDDLETTRNQPKRIELIFPGPVQALSDIATALGLPVPPGGILSYTDPVGTFDGWPRILIQPDPPETRLFTGDGQFSNGNRSGITLVAAEMAHALHFSRLTRTQRDSIRASYIGFLISQAVNGLNVTHAIGVQTSPMTAFLESLDHFSHRLSESVRERHTTYPLDPPPAGRYVLDEMRGRNPVAPRVARLTIDDSGGQRRVEGRPAPGLGLSGSLDEGAVFGGILSLALAIGSLNEVIEAILASRKTNFGQFRNWFNTNRAAFSGELDEVVQVWGL
jgi:hypothetical protein